MYLVLLGAVLELSGAVILVSGVIKHQSAATPASPQAQDSLEPVAHNAPLSLKANWPGIALILVGALLLLLGGRI